MPPQFESAGSDSRSFFAALNGDGRPLLTLTGLCLIFSGGFALFQSATGHFLPHDVDFLGMTPQELCMAVAGGTAESGREMEGCRVVQFMFYDRVAFGGALIAVGILHLWLAEFPLRQGEAWAWWTFLLSGAVGFGSFLAYLGYGYLDTWHGVATLFLLPCFVLGLARTLALVKPPRHIRRLTLPSAPLNLRSAAGIGRLCLLATALGMVFGGGTILVVGMTTVFVPQDLQFMGLAANDLHTINPRLVPLIAHDRAGFGGGIFTCGWLVLLCVWCGRASRSLWQALALSGSAGFACAIGVHFAVGYTDFFHLAPAIVGSISFIFGLALSYRPMRAG